MSSIVPLPPVGEVRVASRVDPKGSVILQQWRVKAGPATVRQRRGELSASKRAYGGAVQGRTVADWIATATSADSELFTSLRTLRNRSRQLVRDNEYAKHVVDRIIPNNVIGGGIGLEAQVTKGFRQAGDLNEKINAKIEAAWQKWQRKENCHTAGRLSFQDIERMILRSVAESGEVLVRKIRQRFGKSRVPLGLEVIEVDQLADNWSGRTNDGNEVRMGVEVDQWQRPVAYWLYPRHPGDFAMGPTQAPSNNWIRVPADEILHIGIFDRPMQTRCVPWLHSVLIKLRHMGGYEEAEIVRARASASVMGFIQSPEIEDPLHETDAMGSDDVVDGERVFDMAPGTIKELSPGETFQGFAPNSANPGMEPFMRFMLRSVAAGVGISYETVAKDYSSANYSSARIALLEDRDQWRILQAWIIRSFHQPVFEQWLDMAVLAGELDLPSYEANEDAYYGVKWCPRGWDWIDPVKEVAAARAAVRAGFTTVAEVIAAKGGDVEDVIKGLKRERKLARDAGLVLDTDPDQTNDKGELQGQAAPPAPPPAPAPAGGGSDGGQAGGSDGSDAGTDSTDDNADGASSSGSSSSS